MAVAILGRPRRAAVEPSCRFFVHASVLPRLPDGSPLELDAPRRLRSLDRCLVDVRAIRAQTPSDDHPATGATATVGLGQEAARRLEDASFVVELELVKSGRSTAKDVVFITELADALARDGSGVVRDVDAQRVFLPGTWRVAASLGELDPRLHVTVHVVADEDTAWIHTHGLAKFGRPEVEVYGVPEDLREPVGVVMLDIAAYVIDGAVIKRGQKLGHRDSPVRVLAGTRNRDHWGDTPVLELAGEEGFRTWATAR